MQTLSTYLRNPKEFLIGIILRTAILWPDKVYLKILYRLKTGFKLNLKNPQTFTEKLQWLKLFNRKDEYTKLVDKFTVKEIVCDKIGREYIIPTIGVWNNVDEIEWEKLPEQFVLKTTHGGGGGGVIICPNKDGLDRKFAKKKLQRSLKSSIYKKFREWPYKNVPKKIIAEDFIQNENKELIDYKFYCFSGKVEYILIVQGRFSGTKTYDYFTSEWTHLDFVDRGVQNALISPIKPKNFEKMIELAEKLALGIPHVRIDLYNLDGKIYFGEYTFFDDSGFSIYEPKDTDLKIGKMLLIDSLKAYE